MPLSTAGHPAEAALTGRASSRLLGETPPAGLFSDCAHRYLSSVRTSFRSVAARSVLCSVWCVLRRPPFIAARLANTRADVRRRPFTAHQIVFSTASLGCGPQGVDIQTSLACNRADLDCASQRNFSHAKVRCELFQDVRLRGARFPGLLAPSWDRVGGGARRVCHNGLNGPGRRGLPADFYGLLLTDP